VIAPALFAYVYALQPLLWHLARGAIPALLGYYAVQAAMWILGG